MLSVNTYSRNPLNAEVYETFKVRKVRKGNKQVRMKYKEEGREMGK